MRAATEIRTSKSKDQKRVAAMIGFPACGISTGASSARTLTGLFCIAAVAAFGFPSRSFAQAPATVFLWDDELQVVDADLKRGCIQDADRAFPSYSVDFGLSRAVTPMSLAAYNQLYDRWAKLHHCAKTTENPTLPALEESPPQKNLRPADDLARGFGAAPVTAAGFERAPSGGFYFTGSLGGGGALAIINSDSDLTGRASGFAVNGEFGYRMRTSQYTWNAFNVGVDWLTKAETFRPPFDDLKVQPGAIIYQSMALGLNIPTPSPGRWFAPYVAFGVAEADIRVSMPAVSDQRWNMAPMVGGGVDFRINRNWLVHTNVSTFWFDRSYRFMTGAPFDLNEKITIGKIGLTYQFAK
jgi:hypothetical protein